MRQKRAAGRVHDGGRHGAVACDERGVYNVEMSGAYGEHGDGRCGGAEFACELGGRGVGADGENCGTVGVAEVDSLLGKRERGWGGGGGEEVAVGGTGVGVG